MIGPSAEELAELQQANEAASEVTNTVLSQRLQLDEKARTVSMLQKALVGCKILTFGRPMEFSIKLDTVRSGWSIVCIEELQILI